MSHNNITWHMQEHESLTAVRDLLVSDILKKKFNMFVKNPEWSSKFLNNEFKTIFQAEVFWGSGIVLSFQKHFEFQFVKLKTVFSQ